MNTTISHVRCNSLSLSLSFPDERSKLIDAAIDKPSLLLITGGVTVEAEALLRTGVNTRNGVGILITAGVQVVLAALGELRSPLDGLRGGG